MICHVSPVPGLVVALSPSASRFRSAGPAGRPSIQGPDGYERDDGTVRRHIDNALVKAVVRAFRWREMLENGTHATIAEI
jgi:hypothetical protein